MKDLRITVVLIIVGLLSACSFSYDVLIVNRSNEPIEVRYKIKENSGFDEPQVKSVDDWDLSKSVSRFWTEEVPWRSLAKDQFHTDVGERIITVQPGEVILVEHGNYNPISEEKGDLTEITELRIISSTGEVSYKGKLLLDQFEKDGYTFIKTYRNELKNEG